MAIAETKPMSLKALIALAAQNNFLLSESELQQNKNAEGVTSARSNLLPSLAIETSANFTEPATSQWSSQAGLVVRQNLYDGGLAWNTLRRSQVTRDRAEASVKVAREKMTFDVIKAFITCGQRENRVRAAKRKLDLLEAQIDLANRKFKQGLKQKRDYQLLEAEVQRAHLAIGRAQNDVFDSYRVLETLIGSPQNTLDDTHVNMIDGDAAVTIAKQKFVDAQSSIDQINPELRVSSLTLKDLDLALSQARRQYWPTLSANATASYGGPNFIGAGSQNWSQRLGWTSSVGLSLNWTLWNWGGTSSIVAQAKIDQQIESKRFAQKKLEVQNLYQGLVHRIERSTRLLEIQRHIRDLERKSVLDTQKEYREGRMGYLDLIAGIERDIESEINQENESYEYFIAMAELMKLKGSLYDSIQKL